jgi:hypothetical protein
MEYKTIGWSPVYSHIVSESLIQSVAGVHTAEFNPGLFRNRWVDNSRTIQNFFNKNRILSDQKLPSVVCGYEIDDDPRNTLEQGDYPFNYSSHFIAGPLSTYYARVYHDPDTKCEIYVAFVRKKITLNFRYLFPDSYLRDDIYSFMLNTFRYNGPPEKFGLSRSVYSAVPQNIFDYFAVIKGLDLNNDDVRNSWHSEIVHNSTGLIRQRKVSMRHTDSVWFMAYSLPDMKMIQSERPQKEDAEQRGQTKTNYGITERLEFEPYVPQIFITKTPKVVQGKLVPDEYKQTVFGSTKGLDHRLYRTRNYEVDPLPEFLSLHPELQVLNSIEFCVERDGEEDIPVNTAILGPFHQWVIDLLKEKHQNVSEYYQIHIYKYDKKLTEDRSYRVNWDDMNIRLINASTRAFYRLCVTCVREFIRPYYNTATIQRLKIKERQDEQ